MLSPTFFAVFTASLIACLITTLGIVVISRFEAWARRRLVHFMSYAAGVLITISFLHIIPESFEQSASAPLFLLLGFFGLHLVNRVLHVHLHEHKHHAHGIIPMVGIGFHSLLDGAIYSVTFNVSIFTGALAALGMILHEFPEGIVTYILLNQAGYSSRKSFVLAFAAAGLSTPLGTLLSYPFISALSGPVLGRLLAISAGALLYVGATHLLPKTEREPVPWMLVSLGAGILTAVGIVSFGK
ncbi:MAG: ZIP family metal transporter [Desulfovibrionales bacterium]